MIIPAAPTDDRYSGGDPYADNNQYGGAGLTSGRYGDQYGTGSYSDYSTGRGRYSSSVEIDRYSAGPRYTSATDSTGGYGDLSTDSYRYGDAQDTMADAGSLDYVLDVLDGDVEPRYTVAAL